MPEQYMFWIGNRIGLNTPKMMAQIYGAGKEEVCSWLMANGMLVAGRALSKVSIKCRATSVIRAMDKLGKGEAVPPLFVTAHGILRDRLAELLTGCLDKNMVMASYCLLKIYANSRNIPDRVAGGLVTDLIRKRYPKPPLKQFMETVRAKEREDS